VRALLLDAAAQVFSAKGLDGATTAEIAQVAGVSESTLFRHFATKADLFTAAAVEPFQAFMDEFASVWEQHQAGGSPDLMREFVTELYDRVAARRDVVRALLQADGEVAGAAALAAFLRMVAQLQRIGADWEQERGERVPALELRERLLIGMVTSAVLFDGWLLALPDGSAFSREAVIDGLIEVARHGAANEPRSGAGPDAPVRRRRR
jgi:AcrR family transcriptional regulator